MIIFIREREREKERKKKNTYFVGFFILFLYNHKSAACIYIHIAVLNKLQIIKEFIVYKK